MHDRVVIDKELARLSALSPSGYMLGLHIRSTSAHMMVQTYDPSWCEIYTQRGYIRADPMVFWGFGTVGVIRWSALDLPDPNQIMKQAESYGLHYGICVSYGQISSRSIGGFARADREFTDQEIEVIHNLVIDLHERSTPPQELTGAQRMALRLIAKGNRHTEAAAKLGISESGLKARLRSARTRLAVRTTTEAIQRAQEYGIL